MGYIQELETELRENLGQMDDEELVKFFKEKVLESYRNGLNAKPPSRGKASSSRGQAKSYGQE